MTASPAKTDLVTITCVLTEKQALAFSQFLKRAWFEDYRSNAVDADEALFMVEAADALRESLARAGYAPR